MNKLIYVDVEHSNFYILLDIYNFSQFSVSYIYAQFEIAFKINSKLSFYTILVIFVLEFTDNFTTLKSAKSLNRKFKYFNELFSIKCIKLFISDIFISLDMQIKFDKWYHKIDEEKVSVGKKHW